jgi:hypothetical protein
VQPAATIRVANGAESAESIAGAEPRGLEARARALGLLIRTAEWMGGGTPPDGGKAKEAAKEESTQDVQAQPEPQVLPPPLFSL